MKSFLLSTAISFIILFKVNGQSVGIGTTTPSVNNKLEVMNPSTASFATAIRAIQGSGSGIGVSAPAAILSESSAGVGLMGLSSGNSGVLGSTTASGSYAGVVGTNSSATGFGVWGLVSSTGIAGFFDGGAFGKGIIVPNGNVGIGTFTPSTLLEVKSSRKYSALVYTDSVRGSVATTNYPLSAPAAINGEFLASGANDGSGVLGTALNSNAGFGVGVTGVGNWYGVLGLGRPGGSAGMYVSANGATYALIALGTFFLNGDFAGTGTNSYASDRNLKKNITTISNALSTIKQIKPSEYEFRTGEFGSMYLPEGKHYGVIAQELQTVLPELVLQQHYASPDKKDKTIDYLSVNYNELIPVLIKGMQEQQEEIELLKAKISKLEEQKK